MGINQHDATHSRSHDTTWLCKRSRRLRASNRNRLFARQSLRDSYTLLWERDSLEGIRYNRSNLLNGRGDPGKPTSGPLDGIRRQIQVLM